MKQYEFEPWSPEDTVRLVERGEFFGVGFFGTDGTVLARMVAALREHLLHITLPEYTGTRLYPSGQSSLWNSVFFSFQYCSYVPVDRDGILRAMVQSADDTTLPKLARFAQDYPLYHVDCGFNHGALYYERILREGLPSYGQRIAQAARLVGPLSEQKADFYAAMAQMHETVCLFIGRIIDYLKSLKIEDENRLELIKEYSALLEGPARSFRGAMVAVNFFFYLDGNDGIGRFDQFVLPYYEQDMKSGLLTRETAGAWIRALWENCNETFSWNVTLGGTTPDGAAAYNDLTTLCLEQAHCLKSPNIDLRLRTDTPTEVWQAAFDCLASGTGIPALYSEDNYLRSLEDARLNLRWDDLGDYGFGGCTETMICGRSNVGSTDHFVNVLKVLEKTLYAHLETSVSFDAFLEVYRKDLRQNIEQALERVNEAQELKEHYCPQPIRSLFMDDCIDAGREYNAGGARYSWTTIGVIGFNNAIDSLTAVNTLIYQNHELTAPELLARLRDNYASDPQFRQQLLALPKFGNGIQAVDALAGELSGYIFREIRKYAYWRGGRCMPAIINFGIYCDRGHGVGATPDGRCAAEPLGDSAGAVQGRDTHGPTALLRSAVSQQLNLATQTPVVNIRFAPSVLRETEGREKLRALVEGYFRMGGLQLQLNCVDQEILRDAIEHPEAHGDLIVRVGGYSDYFNNLSEEMKRTMLERTEYFV